MIPLWLVVSTYKWYRLCARLYDIFLAWKGGSFKPPRNLFLQARVRLVETGLIFCIQKPARPFEHSDLLMDKQKLLHKLSSYYYYI